MSDADPTLKDIWRLLGTMNKRFDALEREVISGKAALAELKAELKAELRSEIGELRQEMRLGFGALRGMIEARDFRLDDHGRRLTDLETSRG
jgi:hypothetical protein